MNMMMMIKKSLLTVIVMVAVIALASVMVFCIGAKLTSR